MTDEKRTTMFPEWDEDELSRQDEARVLIGGIPVFPDLERRLVAAFGPSAEAIMLHQLCGYWFGRPKMADRWTAWKTYAEWKQERGLGRKAVDGGRRRLRARGFIEEAKGAGKKVHYRVDWARLAVELGLMDAEDHEDTVANLDESDCTPRESFPERAPRGADVDRTPRGAFQTVP